MGDKRMVSAPQTYHLKVDSSGRILLPSDARERHRIANGDTVVVTDDTSGLRIKTLDEVIADAQAYFAKLVPRGVLLSEELLADRRSEIERD
jgi:AbrB family looped-hinge helix DNA binding protein